MGLDAEVSCTCYQQGRAISPFPEHTRVNDEGELVLDLPRRGHEDEHALFDEWRYSSSPCEHPEMVFCRVRISNWGGYHSFQSALEEAGWEHFPTLHSYLPENNGGHLPAHAAETALEELATFRRIYAGTLPVLVNAETGELVKPMGYSIMGGRTPAGFPYVVGMDRGGVYVTEYSDPPQLLFRSSRFEQHLTPGPEDLSPAPWLVTYRDVATGEECHCPLPLVAPIGSITMQVEQRGQTAASFTYILDPLEQILQASVRTGNPVRWM